MIASLALSFVYVTLDMFFWPSMAFTTIIGIYIGAVTHNGSLLEIKKTIVSLICYLALITTVNLSRIFPQLLMYAPSKYPLASTVAITLVTIFYLFGMFLGVALVKKAHKREVNL